MNEKQKYNVGELNINYGQDFYFIFLFLGYHNDGSHIWFRFRQDEHYQEKIFTSRVKSY
jgi:hypothetical protein